MAAGVSRRRTPEGNNGAVQLPWQYCRTAGAAGMGLTIVREICRSHGGEASVVEREGGGATVRVELKRKQARATPSNGA
jgi:signal transduction histidine kinase